MGRLAIVVGGLDHGESDRIVHTLTPEGRLDLFAPGAKRSRKRFSGAFQPLQTLRVDLHRPSRSRGLVTVTSAQVLEPRVALRRDLGCIALARYAAELGRWVAPEGEDSPAFDRVSEVLDHLCREPASPAVRRAFELRLIASLGFAPAVGRCGQCGRPTDVAHVDFDSGGCLCPDHRSGAVRVGPGTQRWMAWVLEQPSFAPAGASAKDQPERAARTLGPAVDVFFRRLVEHPLRSLSLLDEVL